MIVSPTVPPEPDTTVLITVILGAAGGARRSNAFTTIGSVSSDDKTNAVLFKSAIPRSATLASTVTLKST